MLFRGLLVSIFLAATAGAALGQTARVDIRPHPPQTTHVLSVHPTEERAVYASDHALHFESAAGIRTVRLDGSVMSLRASHSGAYAAAVVRKPAASTLDLNVYAAEGSAHSSRQISHHADDRQPRAAVSDVSGDLVYALPSTAEVCFAGGGSGDARCTGLFKYAPYATEREVLVDYSPDGRLIAVAAQREAARPGMSDADANVHVFLFDRSGTLLWTEALPEPGLRSLAFSPTTFLVVSTYDGRSQPEPTHATRLITAEGSTLAEAPFGAHAFAFRGSEVLLQTPRGLAVLDANTGTSRVVFHPENGSQIVAIDTAAPSDAGETAILTGRTIYTEDGFAFDALRLVHVNAVGAVFDQVDLDVPPQISPRIRQDENITAVVLDHATEFYAR